nr:replication factor C subunit 3-like [Lytechinus pictus]
MDFRKAVKRVLARHGSQFEGLFQYHDENEDDGDEEETDDDDDFCLCLGNMFFVRKSDVKVQSGDFPHLMVYGPSGAGKKTRIMCALRELYGSGVEKLRIEHQTFMTPSKSKIEITTIASNYHIEVNPSDAGIYDRIVIQDLIKNTAQFQQMETSSQRDFKVVVLTEVDRLTKDAQHALRRTMEKYTSTCRLILCCNSTSKVIPAIRSRCLGVRVAAPSVAEITQILQNVCKKEGLNLPSELGKKIAEKSERNLRKAILSCEACKVQQYPFSADQDIPEADWEIFLRETANHIIQQQSPRQLLEVRGRMYELLTHCIPPDVILKGLLRELLKNCDGQLKTEITHQAAFYEHRMQQGNKAIYHLEAFVAKFMSIYKRYLEEGFEAMMF